MEEKFVQITLRKGTQVIYQEVNNGVRTSQQ